MTHAVSAQDLVVRLVGCDSIADRCLFTWEGGSAMEPRKGEKKVRLELVRLEDRLAPAHVQLPLAPPGTSGSPGIQVAAEANPHAGGFRDFSFGLENPTTIGSATGGAGAGKIKFNEF